MRISVNVPPAGKSIPAEQRIKLAHDSNDRDGELRFTFLFELRRPGRLTNKEREQQQRTLAREV